MSQATRTTKILLDLSARSQGGANTGKRAMLDETASLLNAARAFYIDFFLAHAQKLAERVPYYSEKHLEMRERVISANELLTWAEVCTVETSDHPEPLAGWSFTERFPGMPFVYRRSVIKDAIGKSRRMNRKQANQLRGKINQKAREKAFVEGIVTVEVNPHGTSQYCSRCGLKGERFSFRDGKRIKEPWGKLFWCPHCRYQVHADWNGSANVHHSFYQEFHWQPPRNESA